MSELTRHPDRPPVPARSTTEDTDELEAGSLDADRAVLEARVALFDLDVLADVLLELDNAIGDPARIRASRRMAEGIRVALAALNAADV